MNASAGNDYLSFSAAVFSTSTVAGGAGADTFVFQTSVAGAAISLGAGNDSVSFVTQVSSATIWGAADATNTQTLVFSSVGDAATFTGGFGAGFISLGAGNDSITFSGAGVTGTTITGTDNSDTIKLLGQNTAVFGSAIGTSAQVSFGSGADMATFRELSVLLLFTAVLAVTPSPSLVLLPQVPRSIRAQEQTAFTSVPLSKGQPSQVVVLTPSPCKVRRQLSLVLLRLMLQG